MLQLTMFTGIIRVVGTIQSVIDESHAKHLIIAAPAMNRLQPGDSLALNGACLTVLSTKSGTLEFRLMAETLKKTNLGTLQAGDKVNLEQPLAVGDTLDGHFVQGHIDGVAKVTAITTVGDDKIFTCAPPPSLIPYLIPKGSVTLDGVSLTVVDVTENSFTVSLMPYTLAHTTFGTVSPGYRANIEVDMLGKYVASLIRSSKLPHQDSFIPSRFPSHAEQNPST